MRWDGFSLGVAAAIVGCLSAVAEARAEVSIELVDPVLVAPQAEQQNEAFAAVSASSGSGWLTAYTAADGRLMGQRFDSAGAAVGAAFEISPTDGAEPRVIAHLMLTFDGTSFVVAWEEVNTNEIYAQRVSTAGAVSGPSVLVDSDFFYPGGGWALAAVDDQLLFVGCGNEDETAVCKTALFVSNQPPITGSFESGFKAARMSLAHSGSTWLLTFVNAGYYLPLTDAAFRRLGADGAPLDANDVNLPDGHNVPGVLTSAAAVPSGFVVLFGPNRVSRVDAQGNATTKIFEGVWASDLVESPNGDLMLSYVNSPSSSEPNAAALWVWPLSSTLELGTKVSVPLAVELDGMPTSNFSSPVQTATSADSAGLLVTSATRRGQIQAQRVPSALDSTSDVVELAPRAFDDQRRPRAAAGGNRWLVAWEQAERVFARTLDSDGEVDGAVQNLGATAGAGVYSIAGSESGWLVAWNEGNDTMVRAVTADGQAAGGLLLPEAADLRLAATANGWLAVFSEKTNAGYRVSAKPFSATGQPGASQELLPAADRAPAVAVQADGDRYRAYWSADGEAWTQLLNADGSSACSPALLAHGVTANPVSSFAAMSGGAWLQWQSAADGPTNLLLPGNEEPLTLANAIGNKQFKTFSRPIALRGLALGTPQFAAPPLNEDADTFVGAFGSSDLAGLSITHPYTAEPSLAEAIGDDLLLVYAAPEKAGSPKAWAINSRVVHLANLPEAPAACSEACGCVRGPSDGVGGETSSSGGEGNTDPTPTESGGRGGSDPTPAESGGRGGTGPDDGETLGGADSEQGGSKAHGGGASAVGGNKTNGGGGGAGHAGSGIGAQAADGGDGEDGGCSFTPTQSSQRGLTALGSLLLVAAAGLRRRVRARKCDE